MSKLNDTFEKINGIYKISNTKTNLVYIGSSNNLQRRLHRHFYELSHNIHKNYKIQNVNVVKVLIKNFYEGDCLIKLKISFFQKLF